MACGYGNSLTLGCCTSWHQLAPAGPSWSKVGQATHQNTDVAYFSKTMNDAQRNYDVYNRKLLGLQEMFKHWRAYLHGAAHQVKVHTDHANLLFWKNPGDHNRRVAQWHSDLMDYDFQLVHISSKKNGCMDALSRCPDYNQGEDDNKQLVVLPPKFFSQVLAHIAGSEEANPNNEKE